MPTPDSLDSRPDTLDHIRRVAELLHQCQHIITQRALNHDKSKLEEPEKSGFDRLRGLADMAYGSEEYKECLRREKPTIDHHYAFNSHHPEHYPKRTPTQTSEMLRASAREMLSTAKDAEGSADPAEIKALCDFAVFNLEVADQLEAEVNGMSLFDILEMLVDWKAASERMKDGGNIWRSIELNEKRFKLSPQLVSILRNTAFELGWPAVTPTPANDQPAS